MNKVLTVGVSVLTTAAACAGVVGVLANVPDTKDMFDFQRKNQEIISELKADITEKDSLLAEKSNQITAQEVTINELNQLLPKEIVIPDNLIFNGGVKLFDVNDEFVFVSSLLESESNGLYRISKLTGKITQLSDSGYLYKVMFKLKNGGYLLTTSTTHADVVITDENGENPIIPEVDVSFSKTVDGIIESDKYILIGSKSSKSIALLINKEDYSAYVFTKLFVTQSVIYGDYYLDFQQGSCISVTDLITKEVEEITIPSSKYHPYIYKNEVYAFSKVGFYKFTLADKSFTELIGDLSLTDVPYAYEELADGICLFYGVGTYTNTIFVNFNDMTLLDVGMYTSSIERVVIDENRYLVSDLLTTGRIFYVNLLEKTFTQLSSTAQNLLKLPNGNILCSGYSEIGLFDVSTNEYTVLATLSYGSKFVKCEDLGEGRYRLSTEDESVKAIYNLEDNSVTVYSLIIE